MNAVRRRRRWPKYNLHIDDSETKLRALWKNNINPKHKDAMSTIQKKKNAEKWRSLHKVPILLQREREITMWVPWIYKDPALFVKIASKFWVVLGSCGFGVDRRVQWWNRPVISDFVGFRSWTRRNMRASSSGLVQKQHRNWGLISDLRVLEVRREKKMMRAQAVQTLDRLFCLFFDRVNDSTAIFDSLAILNKNSHSPSVSLFFFGRTLSLSLFLFKKNIKWNLDPCRCVISFERIHTGPGWGLFSNSKYRSATFFPLVIKIYA